LNGLTMIVTILNQGEDEEDPYEDYVMEETQITVEELPPILRAIHTHLPSLHEKLTRPSTELMNIPGGAVRPLGEAKLKILQFITSLVKQNTTALTERIIELKLHNAILVRAAFLPLTHSPTHSSLTHSSTCPLACVGVDGRLSSQQHSAL